MTSFSCGGRNRTHVTTVQSRLPVPARDPPHHLVRTAGFEPAISCARSTRNARLSHVLKSQSAQRESNRAPPGRVVLPPWQGSRLPLHHGRLLCCQIVKDRKSTGPPSGRCPDSNPRRRITRAESSPLDDQCFQFQVGPLGLEPRPARLRAGDAAANTSIPCCLCHFNRPGRSRTVVWPL